MRLTEALADFRIDGYAIIPGVVDPDACRALAATLQGHAHRAGLRHAMQFGEVRAFAEQRVLTEIASAALGSQAVPYKATLFDKSGTKNWLIAWHQDTALPLASRFNSPGWGPWSTKDGRNYAHAPTWALERVVALRIQLDASLPDNGSLRVIPGSHRRGVLTDAEVFELAA